MRNKVRYLIKLSNEQQPEKNDLCQLENGKLSVKSEN